MPNNASLVPHLPKHLPHNHPQPCRSQQPPLCATHPLAAAAIAACVVAAWPAVAQTQTQAQEQTQTQLQAQASSQSNAIHIPAQALDSALASLAQRSGASLAYTPQLVQGKQANAVQGAQNVGQALAQMLRGTGLQAHQQGQTWVIQPAPAESAAPEAQGHVQTLPEVVVASPAETATGPVIGYRARRAFTATKTDTLLAETPQAVTVVTRDQMTDQGMTNVQDALTYAAGVRSDLYGLDSRNDAVAVRGASPVKYLDGLRGNYNWYTSTIRFDPYTLERVEVLRGPAGMLFGAGSVGGVMNMVSKRPQFEHQREVGLQLGSFNRRQVQMDLTGPINEQLAWRLVSVARKSDTQVDHVRDDRALLMPSLTWQPRASTSLTLHALWQRDKSGNTAQFFPWTGTLFPAVPGYLPTNRFIGEPDDFYNTRHTHIGWRFEHAFNDQWTLRQNFRHSRNANEARYFWADYETIPGGWGADPDNQRILRRVLSDTRTRTRMTLADTHVQGKLNTGDAQHTVLAGLDVIRFNEKTWRARGESLIDAWNPVYGQFTPSGEYTARAPTHQHQVGLYAQDQIKWGPWALTAGLRHDRARSGAQGSPAAKSSATTGRFAAMYLSPQHWNPYISYTESFLPQAPRSGQSFKPLKGKQWELGVKYEPPGQALAFNAAIYDLREVNRIQQPRPDEYNQLGQTRTRGLELEARGQIGRRFDLLGHYNYIDLDKQLEGVPKHQASVWGMYRFGDARQQGWSAGAGLRWASAFRDGSGPRTPSSTLLDLMLAYDSGPWRVALNVQNATDKVYFAACLERGDCWWGARRNVLLTASYRF